ncbi:MAG: carbohydrate kinase family protein [Chloroflexi bacterium]|nr:carbohydrate kinase family protein [Chloroflexota bacterium]
MPQFPALGREICSTDLTTTGGAMYITAASLTRLGAHVGWPAYFGNDSYSHFVHDLARQEGVDLSLAKVVDRPYRLVTTSIPFSGERAFVTYADPDPDDLYQHWLNSLQRSEFKHVHIGGFMLEQDLMALIRVARDKGATISMDCQDGPHLHQPCKCRDLAREVDIFMPNAREAVIVAETDDVASALDRLMQVIDVVVIKDGANGVLIGHQGAVTHVPAIQAGEVVDTTGAGDCFNAGFLYGYIVEGASLEQSGIYGNICGGLSVTGVGGATNAPTHAELMRWSAQLTS